MTEDEVEAFLHERQTMNIASFGPDGNIHLVAMWYGFLDDQLAFWTFGKSQKIVNLRRDPKITALVEEGDAYSELRGVELVGTGRIVEDYETIVRIALSVAERHVGPAGVSDDARPFIEAQAHKRLGVVIDVERTASWDHRKLGGRY